MVSPTFQPFDVAIFSDVAMPSSSSARSEPLTRPRSSAAFGSVMSRAEPSIAESCLVASPILNTPWRNAATLPTPSTVRSVAVTSDPSPVSAPVDTMRSARMPLSRILVVEVVIELDSNSAAAITAEPIMRPAAVLAVRRELRVAFSSAS